MELAPFYRVYELPWSPTEEIERRFRNVLRIALLAFTVIALIIPFLPVPDKTRLKTNEIPERIVKMLIERKPPPPPPPPELPKPEDLKPEKVPEAPKPPPTAQEQAKKAMLKLQDELADLRDIKIPESDPNRELIGTVAENASSERNLITSQVGGSSGGINTAALSRGYGAGAGPLGTISTGRVTSEVSKAAAANNVKRAPGSTKAARSEEEIVRIFDRNKGAIYAIYTRALRDKPDLKGKLVLSLTISPEGEITNCEVISSELGDPELERKLVARVKLFRFEPRDVGTITVTKPIDFFPA
jgi:periplasmic protein TonB